ncbi:hypothetical protein [Hyphococcus luteus]|uniref:hypothetical protein n=1 Tax=Hyphococcus luteus TaxID=2058213 RepID=UPI0010575244|nr:hypothetical protein [Marinicaulis flavus]
MAKPPIDPGLALPKTDVAKDLDLSIDKIVLEPQRVRNELRRRSSSAARVAACGVQRSGLAPGEWWREGLIYTGYAHFWNDKPRKRCEHGVSYFLQPILEYDMEPVRGREIKSAVLHFQDSSFADVAAFVDDPEYCYAPDGRVGMIALADRNAGDGNFTVKRLTSGREGVLRNISGTVRPDLRGGSWKLDVTEWVKGWADGSLNNHGIAFTPWTTKKRKHDRICVGVVQSADIVVTFK